MKGAQSFTESSSTLSSSWLVAETERDCFIVSLHVSVPAVNSMLSEEAGQPSSTVAVCWLYKNAAV